MSLSEMGFSAIFLFIPLLLLCYLQPFWFRQLRDCFRKQKENRLRWLLLISLLNVIGAFYYWRLTPHLPQDPDAFDKQLDNWLAEKGLSLEKGKKRLQQGEYFAAKLTAVWLVVMILQNFAKRGAFDQLIVPGLAKYLMLLGVLLVAYMVIKKIIRLWKDETFIARWLIIPILQAKSGNRRGKMFLGAIKQYDTKRIPVSQLFQADFFLFCTWLFLAATYLVITGNLLEEDESTQIIWLSYIFPPTFALLMGFVSLRSNTVVVFYNRPEFVFFVMKHYKVLSIISYCVSLLIALGFVSLLANVILYL